MKESIDTIWDNITDRYFSGMYPFKPDPYRDLHHQVRKQIREIALLRRELTAGQEESQEKQEKMMVCLIQLMDEFKQLLETHQSARKNKKQSHDMFDLYQGMYEKILYELTGHGLHVIEVEEERFDPHKHQADDFIDLPEHEEGHIHQTVKPGFVFEGKVLRKPQVLVVKHEKTKTLKEKDHG